MGVTACELHARVSNRDLAFKFYCEMTSRPTSRSTIDEYKDY